SGAAYCPYVPYSVWYLPLALCSNPSLDKAIITMNFPDMDYLSPENLQKLRLKTPSLPAPPIRGQFLRGPIPLAWLTAAARLPGKAPLAVAPAVRFEAGRRGNSQTVKLTNPLVAKLGVSRKSKYSALNALEQAGLVAVRRESRKAPVV